MIFHWIILSVRFKPRVASPRNFWWIFEPHFFRVYYFSSKQEACQEVLLEQEVNEYMSECHPSYLKTVSQLVVSRIRTHSLRFLTPNTAVLVEIIQIHTNFGCLKWFHTKKNISGNTIFCRKNEGGKGSRSKARLLVTLSSHPMQFQISLFFFIVKFAIEPKN
jgi:hypothetical protein